MFYFVYFLAGTAIGAYGLERSFLRRGGSFANHWWLCLTVGLVSYVVLVALLIGGRPSPTIPYFMMIAFAVSCMALVFGFTVLFLRFATRRVGLFISFAASAYGVYIVHYVFVNWIQYGLLSVELSAIMKATIVFVGALLLSWGVAAALRRIPLVDRVI